jgi:hypothetical protein
MENVPISRTGTEEEKKKGANKPAHGGRKNAGRPARTGSSTPLPF